MVPVLILNYMILLVYADDLDVLEVAEKAGQISAMQTEVCENSIDPNNIGRTTLYTSLNPNEQTVEKIVRVTLDSAKDLPEDLKRHIPGEVFERSKDGKVDVIISMPNDNLGLGLWQLVTGHDTGNDFGATHGFKVQVGKDVDGLYMQGQYETNLYTQRARAWSKTGNRWTAGQFFTEENIAKFVIDNQNKGKAYFWQAGVGAIELNSAESRGWLFASGQQKGFHDLVGAWAPTYLPDGHGQRSGAFVEGTIGKTFSDNIAMGGKVRIKTTGQVTGILSTLEDTSSVSAKATAQAFYQSEKNKKSYTVEFGLESTSHQTAGSPTTNAFASVGMAGKKMGAKLTVSQTIAGARQNYVNYNLDKDKTYTFEFFRKIGQGRDSARTLFDKNSLKNKSQTVTVGSFELEKH